MPDHLLASELELAVYRVRRDAARAPKGWGPIFEQLACRLFDPQLRIKTLRKAHRLARPAKTRAFAEVFGCEPGEYLTRLRIETVQALLAIESLTVRACAWRVGFTSLCSFEETYKRLCDETPTETRARLAAAGKTSLPQAPADPGLALRGLLTLQDPPEAIAAACRALHERSLAGLRERAGGAESWERLLAEEWWAQVREQPAPGLWVLLEGRLETGAAFETLCRASRADGRDNRRRGLELAQLALESLVLLSNRLEPSYLAELEIRGLAELGNAYRRLHDFSAAEKANAAAERRLGTNPGARPEVHAHLFLHKAALYTSEHRVTEALPLAHRALALAGEARVLRAEILLVRGDLLLRQNRVSEAIADFQAAFELLSPAGEPFLAWAALQNVAIGWHKAGDDAAARSWLARAEPIVRCLGQPKAVCFRDWLVGLLAANQGDLAHAELHLRRAHAGYEQLKDVSHGALISLDLTTLYLRLARPAEAAQLAAEALPQLASLGLTAEGIEALALLRQALEASALSTAVLERVRGCIARVVGAPALGPKPER